MPALEDFDYAFAENGLTAYKLGGALQSQSFIKYLGEDNYKKLVNFILHYLADMDVPVKRSAAPYLRCCASINFSIFQRHFC